MVSDAAATGAGAAGMTPPTLALLASHNNEIYRFGFRCLQDIADRVGAPNIEALSSSDGVYHYWLTASRRGGSRLNVPASKLLYAVSGFSARETPLLRGHIVITSSDPTGRPVGLTAGEMDALLARLGGLSGAAQWTLDRRFRRQQRRDRREREHLPC